MTDVVNFNSSSRADCGYRDRCYTHVANQPTVRNEVWDTGWRGERGDGGVETRKEGESGRCDKWVTMTLGTLKYQPCMW